MKKRRSPSGRGTGPERAVAGKRCNQYTFFDGRGQNQPPMVLLRVAGLPYVVNVDVIAEHARLGVPETEAVLKRLSARADIPISVTFPAEEGSGR